MVEFSLIILQTSLDSTFLINLNYFSNGKLQVNSYLYEASFIIIVKFY